MPATYDVDSSRYWLEFDKRCVLCAAPKPHPRFIDWIVRSRPLEHSDLIHCTHSIDTSQQSSAALHHTIILNPWFRRLLTTELVIKLDNYCEYYHPA